MRRYILRLDDASDYMDVAKWEQMVNLLDQYDIKPIFGIIPRNRDNSMTSKYKRNEMFWEWAHQRIEKGWVPAMHGYEHKYHVRDAENTEFKGLTYEIQCKKIEAGYAILREHGIETKIFFAPSHTFDNNTLLALRDMTPIRIVSDTIARDVYKKGEFWFVPMQSWRVSWQPFCLTTFCYHPNTISLREFERLRRVLPKYKKHFVRFELDFLSNRNLDFIDVGLRGVYVLRDTLLSRIIKVRRIFCNGIIFKT